MKHIRHQERSRDSLYKDIEQNVETIFRLWEGGERTLRFSIPILCAAKLEAFINVTGKLKCEHWDILERKLAFADKCKIVFSTVGLVFEPTKEPNKGAIAIFEIRNSLVHPKMKLDHIDEYISQEEYEKRNSAPWFEGSFHHLRSELTDEKVRGIKQSTDTFVAEWGGKLLDGAPEYWLGWGSTGGFRFEPPTG